MRYLHRFAHTPIGKILIALTGILALVSLLLFTPWGNRLLSPIVEKTIRTQLSEEIVIDDFTLRHNRFELLFHDTQKNTVSLQGGFSLLTMQLYAHYRIACPDGGGINPLQTPVHTDGAFKGGYGAFDVHGDANLYSGKIIYGIQLHRFTLANLNLTLTDIAYEPLMHQLGYPSDTDTRISGKIDLSGLERRDVAGIVEIISETKRFSPTPILEDTNESFDIRSLLADENGRIKAFDVNVSFAASLTDAGILEQFVKIPLKGPLEASGSLRGNKALLSFELRSPVAKSETSLSLTVPDLDPSHLVFSIRHADLSRLFTLFSLPPPLTGTAEAEGDFNRSGGRIDLRLTNARSVPHVLKEEYNITQPPLRFDAEIAAKLSDSGVRYHGMFRSDLGRMEIDQNTTHPQMLRDLLNSLP